MTIREQIIAAAIDTMEELRPTSFIPNPATRGITSTGNLAFNAFQYEITKDEIVIYVNEDIAPYMPYTNEPWLSPYWNGKKNPNEGWWQRFVDEFAHRLAVKLNGSIEE